MLQIHELRAASKNGTLTREMVLMEIHERAELIKTMVGQLYPGILTDEICELEVLPCIADFADARLTDY
jgi:hypothetical protein